MSPDESLELLIESAPYQNAWYTAENTRKAITAIGRMLNQEDLEKWLESTENSGEVNESKSVGLVLAGNIPLVGFHDILCVLASGNKALIKLSSQDQKLIPFILNKLVEIEP